MRSHSFALVVFAVFSAVSASSAYAGHGVHCPRCRQFCDVTVEKTTDTKYCWKIECQPICIPRVTFPWEVCKSSCDDCPQPARCARVKHVNVLVKHEYECPACKYTFTPCPNGCACGQHQPAAGDATAAAPFAPSVNIELQQSTAAPLPSSAAPRAAEPQQPPAQRSYLEIVTGFFR